MPEHTRHQRLHRTVVLNVVGLSPDLIGPNTPHLKRFAEQGKQVPVGALLPAVTCSVQATYLTGTWPSQHGVVGNGWYFRDECEVKFWRQSNRLVQQPKLWEEARRLDPTSPVRTCSGGTTCIPAWITR